MITKCRMRKVWRRNNNDLRKFVWKRAHEYLGKREDRKKRKQEKREEEKMSKKKKQPATTEPSPIASSSASTNTGGSNGVDKQPAQQLSRTEPSQIGTSPANTTTTLPSLTETVHVWVDGSCLTQGSRNPGQGWGCTSLDLTIAICLKRVWAQKPKTERVL